jgi:hypothetical protein
VVLDLWRPDPVRTVGGRAGCRPVCRLPGGSESLQPLTFHSTVAPGDPGATVPTALRRSNACTSRPCAPCAPTVRLKKSSPESPDGTGPVRTVTSSLCDDDTLQFRLEAYRADVAYPLLVRSLDKLAPLSPSIRVRPSRCTSGSPRLSYAWEAEGPGDVVAANSPTIDGEVRNSERTTT